MKFAKKLLVFCLVSLCCALFAISASAEIDTTNYDALSEAQKTQVDACLTAYGEYDQDVLDTFVNAAKVLSYKGLQTRYEGIPGIRSLWTVDTNAAIDTSIVAYGAIMAIDNGTNTPSNLVVAYDDENGYVCSNERSSAVTVYANGEHVGKYTRTDKSEFAFTTTYSEANQNCRNMHQKELVYRGFVVCKVADVEYILYVDGVGSTFGKETATYGIGASVLELATYYADAYPDSETLALVRSADEYAWAPSKMPTLTAAGELAYACAGCGEPATGIETMELPMTSADATATVEPIEGETNLFKVTASKAGFYMINVQPNSGSYQLLYNTNEDYKFIVRVKQAQSGNVGYPVYLTAGENEIYFSGTMSFDGETMPSATVLLVAEPSSFVVPDVNADGANVNMLQANKTWNYGGKKLTIEKNGFYLLSSFLGVWNQKITDFTLSSADHTVSFVPNSAVDAANNEINCDGSTSGSGFQNLALVYLKAGTYSLSITTTGTNRLNVGPLFATRLDIAHTCEYEKTVSGATFTYACPLCGDVKGVVEFTEPTVETPAEIEITLDEAGKTFVVPGTSVTVSGFYEVILKHETGAETGYTTLVNNAYPAFISRNRDKKATAGEYSTERVFTVYLEAGVDNTITYSGNNLTGAKLTLRDAISLDLTLSAIGATYTKSVDGSQGKIINGLYEFRASGILTYASTLTVASEGFYRIGGNMNCASSDGTFTFTDANGNEITAKLDATNNDTKKDGSTSAVYAKNIGFVYLPAGEYTVSFKLGAAVNSATFGSIVLEALEHNHDVTVEYNTPATCTTPGLTGTGCIVCGEGATVVPAGHSFDGENDAVCNACGTVRKYSITPTFTTTNNKTWTITVPGSQIQVTGIYRFKIAGTITAGGYVTVTSSSDANFLSRVKFSAVGDDGYAASWHEVFIAAVDANEDGVNDDVTVTLTDASNAQTITAMSLELIGKVVAYTYEKVGTEGTIASIAAGTYTVATFANGANNWSCTVNVNGTDLTDSQKASGVSQNGNYYNGSTQHNGSTNSAGFMNMGTVSFDADATDVKTLVTLTGDIEAGTNNKAPVYLMNLVD